jgi:CrcB protein
MPPLSPFALLLVALGGAIGSVARYAAGVVFAPTAGGFPTATVLVNVVGSFLIGCFARIFPLTAPDPVFRLLLITGFCGGFTTFSTFSAETLAMVQQGRALRALLYIGLSLGLGLGATALGLMVARSSDG